MSSIKRTAQRGFTLIELMIVVVIIGVLAALAIYGVSKYVANAKSAEARNYLGRITKDGQMVFAGEDMAGNTTLAFGTTRGSANFICPTSTDTVPTGGSIVVGTPGAPAVVSGQKWQSSPTDWNTNAGFACSRSTLTDPQYYAYALVTTNATAAPAAAAAGNTSNAIANGDLDGDGTASQFYLLSTVQNDAGQLVLTAAPAIEEVNPDE